MAFPTAASIRPLSTCSSWPVACWVKASRLNSREFIEVSVGLHRALGLRPWQIDVLDFDLYTMTPESFPSHAGYDLVRELHRRLVAAA